MVGGAHPTVGGHVVAGLPTERAKRLPFPDACLDH